MIKRKNKKEQARKAVMLGAHLTGRVVPIDQVGDEVFSGRILGDGIAVKPTVGELYAPTDGEILQIFETLHALTMVSDAGVELLFHIGIDTLQLGGRFFTVLVGSGERVKAGQLLVRFDADGIANEGYDLTTPMVVSNSEGYALRCVSGESVNGGQPLLELTPMEKEGRG